MQGLVKKIRIVKIYLNFAFNNYFKVAYICQNLVKGFFLKIVLIKKQNQNKTKVSNATFKGKF